MFDNSLFYAFAVTVAFLRAKAPVSPHILDVVIMIVVVKGDVFEFIGHRNTKNWMVLCELNQD